MTQLPVVAITMGDPRGIGPEVVAKALALLQVRELCLPLVIGSTAAMEQGVHIARAHLAVREAQHPGDVDPDLGAISVLDPHNLNYEDIILGQVSAEAGKACMEWVELAAHLCLGG